MSDVLANLESLPVFSLFLFFHPLFFIFQLELLVCVLFLVRADGIACLLRSGVLEKI